MTIPVTAVSSCEISENLRAGNVEFIFRGCVQESWGLWEPTGLPKKLMGGQHALLNMTIKEGLHYSMCIYAPAYHCLFFIGYPLLVRKARILNMLSKLFFFFF